MTSSVYTYRPKQHRKDLLNDYLSSPRANMSSIETRDESPHSRSRSRERERSSVREKYAKAGKSHGYDDDPRHELRRENSKDQRYKDERDGYNKHRESDSRNFQSRSPNSMNSGEERTSPTSRSNEDARDGYSKNDKVNKRFDKDSEEFKSDFGESSRSTSPTGINMYYKENQEWKQREDSKKSKQLLNSDLPCVACGRHTTKGRSKMEEEFEIDSDEERRLNGKKLKKPATNIPLTGQLGQLKVADPRKQLIHKFRTEEKLNLIIDLDETLLNSAGVDRKFDVKLLKNVPPECIHEIQNEGDSMRVLVVLRPYYNQFLARLSKAYNIFAYSHGRWDYVQKVVELLDPERKYIRRDTIFKNTGQVGKTTPKLLSALGLIDKEAHKTVILDDQKYIWEVASKKVLSSKKFIPLKDLMQEEKFLKYALFTKEEEGGKNHIWTVNHTMEPFGLKLFAEFDMVNQKTSQLESLANFLEEIHQEYNLNKLSYPAEHDKLKVEKLVDQKLKKIIYGLKISIVSSQKTRTSMFKDLAQMMGGVVVPLNQAHVVVMDGDTDHEQKQEVIEMLDESPLATVLSADWLVECFFEMKKVNTRAFKIKSIL